MINIPAPLLCRPFHVSVEGGKISVSVRDAFHLEREREFKCQIRLTSERNGHCGACSRTRNHLKARRHFQAEEARWYASSGPVELRPRNLIGGGMNGMVAGWIVSVALFLVCGAIAFALAKIVNSLDQMSAMPDESGWNTLAQDARPAFSG